MLSTSLTSIKGGFEDQVIRQVVRNVPRDVARGLNHTAIRSYQALALHFQLDLRRPEVHRRIGVGAPGNRQRLTDTVEAYLRERYLPENVDREPFVQTGMQFMRQVDGESGGG
jgi:hypothetical protein